MPYAKYFPAPPLGDFVACFWYWEGAPRTPAKERLMPTGEPCVIVNLRDDSLRVYTADDLDRGETYGPAMLSGARTRPFAIHNAQQDRVFGIQFHSGGAFPFFRVPASEMANLAVPLDVLWGGRAGEFRERLLAAESIAEMFKIAESVMLAQAARPLRLHPAVSFALGYFRRVSPVATVGGVTEQLGLSHRRFIAVFRECGLTPKAFCRVRRFQHVLRSIHGAREVDWADVSLDSGYFDQAHFIHDFRAFSSLTPTEYWINKTQHLNHVPIPQ
ncbi:MAG: DUF6597 domain-containing transcriptional factor [Bryobacteraceae bacterium]